MNADTTTAAGRIVGGLMLSAFGLYGVGGALVKAATGGRTAVPANADSPGRLSTGSMLMLANSAAVAGIGVLGARVLRRGARRTARVYLGARIAEATLLAGPPASTLCLVALARRGVRPSDDTGPVLSAAARAVLERSETTYWLAMTTLATGSVAFCRALLDGGLLPRPLAVWGIAGYAVFAAGGVLQLAGHEVGLPLSIPGGVFEGVAGTYLLIKGFGADA
jgi:hypothetical protein